MIDQQQRQNPLRWTLALLLLGIVASLAEPIPQLKFQAQRLTELLAAVTLLAWSYRPQPASILEQLPLPGWYGLGLLGFAAAALLSAAAGPVAWISLGFLGLVLLQFALLPLLKAAWQRHRDDTVRVLALFSLALLGMDVGIWLVDAVFQITPYGWIQRLEAAGPIHSAPYLLLNARWANQLTVLLIWTFIPLLQQLHSGLIARGRRWWWLVALAIPWLGMAQIVLSEGDGAFIAVALGTATLGLGGLRLKGSQRQLVLLAVAALMSGALVAALLSAAIDGSQFFGLLVDRNTQELAPATPTTDKRIVLWAVYGRALLSHPWLGHGLAAIPPGSPACTPHNLWLALLHATGLVGTGCAVLLATAFVPSRLQWQQPSTLMALPWLACLFVYQLVDDLWLRPLSLALLLLILPGLLPDPLLSDPSGSAAHQPSWLRAFAFSRRTWRLIALIGLLLMTVSAVHPAGVGFGPSPLVRASARGACLLLF